ncbi:hypothetical protein ACP70R_033010 [Stipagrostis hirtigluma subsp. patula]
MARRRKRSVSSDSSPEPSKVRARYGRRSGDGGSRPLPLGVVESDSDCDGYHIKHRFSTTRITRLVKSLNDTQKGFLCKHGFGFILNVKKFCIPIGFIEWVMTHTVPGLNEFSYGKKRIKFTPDMVCKVLGIPSGDNEVRLHSDDSEVNDLVAKWKADYKEGRTYPIKKCLHLMKNNNDEESFMRSFLLFLISSIMVPDKSNTVRVNYLYSLVNIGDFASFDWAGHILHEVMGEVRRFQGLRDFLGRPLDISNFYMESCLPMLAIIYMDFLDLPQGNRRVHSLNYSTPRICHLTPDDIAFVVEIDLNTHSGHHHHYGLHPFRDISQTPYSSVVPPEVLETVLHSDVKTLVDKHNLLWQDDLLVLKQDFKNIMSKFERLHHARVMNLASDLNALYSRSGESRRNVEPGIPVVSQTAVDVSSSLHNVVDVVNPNIHAEVPGDVNSPLHNVVTDHDELRTPFVVNSVVGATSGALPDANDHSSGNDAQGIGESTMEKITRKKRKATVVQPSDYKKLKLSSEVEQFYLQYVRHNRMGRRVQNNPTMPAFISVNGFHLTYPEFYESFKATTNLSDKAMVVYANVFNNLSSKDVTSASSRKKICFGPHFSGKLIADPNEFVSQSCLGELKKMHKRLDLTTANLLFFPIIIGEHWVVICLNILYGNMNFFDSLNLIKPDKRKELCENVAKNFTSVCALAKIFPKGFADYKENSPKGYPKQKTIHDCGIYDMIYMDVFDGKTVSNFDQEFAVNFRKLAAYRIATSTINDVDTRNVLGKI